MKQAQMGDQWLKNNPWVTYIKNGIYDLPLV